MKWILIICVLICLIVSCKPKSNTVSPTVKQENINRPDFDYLIGSWARAGNKDGKRTFENWRKINSTLYKGLGYTLMNTDTTFQEHLTIEYKNEEYTLSVDVTGQAQTQTVVFKIDSKNLTGDGFICHSPDNDFPKVIKYKMDGDTLRAEISGGGPTIPFTFYR